LADEIGTARSVDTRPARWRMNVVVGYPKHVHKARRRYLGIEHTLEARRFPFNNTEDFAFFG